MTPKEEMLTYPHRDGLVSYLAHGFEGWDSPGPVDEATAEVRAGGALTGGRCWRAVDRAACSSPPRVLTQRVGIQKVCTMFACRLDCCSRQ